MIVKPIISLSYLYVGDDTITVQVTADKGVSSVKNYDRNMLTTHRLRLAYSFMYNVKRLQVACGDHLKRNLCFENATDVWKTTVIILISELLLRLSV